MNGWIARTWQETDRRLRTACLIMWAAAVLVTVFGAVGDPRGWWTDRPFLTNLVSSLAGALFGVPVAILVIQRIIAAETHRRERQEAVRFAGSIVRELHEGLAALTVAPQLLPDLAEQLRLLTEDLLPALPHRRYGPELERVLRAWQRAHELLPRTLSGQDRAAGVLRDAEARWRYLRDHVEPRLRQHGIASLSTPGATRVGRLMSVAATYYRGSGGHDGDLAAAAGAALADGSLRPLVRLYDVDDDAAIAIIEEHVEEVAVGVRATADLLAAVTALLAEVQSST